MRRYCERCQNTPATLTLTWIVKVWDHDLDAYHGSEPASLDLCDACAELERADHHRDRPTIRRVA